MRTPRYEAIVTHGYLTPKVDGGRRGPDECGAAMVYDHVGDRIVWRVATEQRHGRRCWRLPEAIEAAEQRAAELNSRHYEAKFREDEWQRQQH